MNVAKKGLKITLRDIELLFIKILSKTLFILINRKLMREELSMY